MTNTFILTWNPSSWDWPAADYRSTVRRTAAGHRVKGQWSMGVRRGGVVKGDRAFLLRQHSERGIVASGYFTSEVFEDRHWDGSGRDTTYALVDWDVVVDTDDRLPIDILKAAVSGIAWDRLQGSGTQAKATAAQKLENLWAKHLGDSTYMSPEEVPPTETFREGSMVRVVANRYERDRNARTKCISHWGAVCQVCGLDFAKRYGSIGKGFIHVHHLHSIAAVGEEHEVDPVADLRPVCPNCHAMLHQKAPAMSIADLKKRLR